MFSVLLYACESWTLKKNDRDRLLAFEMRCYRWILNIKWHEKVTNKEIRRQLEVKRSIMQIIIERKLGLFGHICRMKDERLIKDVVFGGMDGKSRRGRPCREWIDDIVEWCQAEVHMLQQSAQDRKEWKKIVEHAINANGC